MTAVESAVRAAGRNLAGEPFRVPLDIPGAMPRLAVARAVYLAFAAGGELHYIGKVDRPATSAAARRLAEHLRVSSTKRSVWRWLWIVPLRPEMSQSDLLAFERSLITSHRPPGNVQHNSTAA
jgi:hypothetical protein